MGSTPDREGGSPEATWRRENDQSGERQRSRGVLQAALRSRVRLGSGRPDSSGGSWAFDLELCGVTAVF